MDMSANILSPDHFIAHYFSVKIKFKILNIQIIKYKIKCLKIKIIYEVSTFLYFI